LLPGTPSHMKKIALLLLVICFGCTSKPKLPAISISLVNNAHSLKIKGLDYNTVQAINSDTAVASWQSLIPVYRMPADADMIDFQKAQPGKYLVTDSTVTFTPDTPFLQHQTYFLRYYHYAQGSNIWDDIKQHQKLGKPKYTDLIFKQ
jgi:hypothetical protein